MTSSAIDRIGYAGPCPGLVALVGAMHAHYVDLQRAWLDTRHSI